mmetsp:Transcript_81231/g.217121  ORF Transcript_81231/g.217121 Transcript_81231/m.217121 type:complete len:355 (+) Transcript_81231:413-1477(+)
MLDVVKIRQTCFHESSSNRLAAIGRKPFLRDRRNVRLTEIVLAMLLPVVAEPADKIKPLNHTQQQIPGAVVGLTDGAVVGVGLRPEFRRIPHPFLLGLQLLHQELLKLLLAPRHLVGEHVVEQLLLFVSQNTLLDKRLHPVQQRIREQSNYSGGLVFLQDGQVDIHEMVDGLGTFRVRLVDHHVLLFAFHHTSVSEILCCRALRLLVRLQEGTNHLQPSPGQAVAGRGVVGVRLGGLPACNPGLDVVEVSQAALYIVEPDVDASEQDIRRIAPRLQLALVHLLPVLGPNRIEEHLPEHPDVRVGLPGPGRVEIHGAGGPFWADHGLVSLVDLLNHLGLAHVEVQIVGGRADEPV